MPGEGIVAGIAGLAGIGQSLIDRGTAKQNVELTYQKNRELADYQYSQQVDMWNRANEYNAPTQQMARLKAAGLNPNLVYGSGAVGNMATQIPQYQSPKVQYDLPPVVNMPNILNAYQDYRLKQAEMDSVKARTDAIKQATSNAAIQGKILGEDLPYRTYRAGREQLKWSREGALQEGTLQAEIAATLAKHQLSQGMAPYQLQVQQGRAKNIGLAGEKIIQDIARSKAGQQVDIARIPEIQGRVKLNEANRRRVEAERQLVSGRKTLLGQQYWSAVAQEAYTKVQTALKQTELDYYADKFWADLIMKGSGQVMQYRKGLPKAQTRTLREWPNNFRDFKK